MLSRQKCLLLMVERAGRPVSHLELTKWAFLLANETPSAGSPAFYQFLPYDYGPFSFCLYREACALVREGYLGDEDGAWRVMPDVPRATVGLERRVRSDAVGVVERFASKPPTDLLAYVYKRFPWFTVNSVIRRQLARPVASRGVYTAGYEGWLVDGFLNMLMRAGIRQVIDVRSNPVARRYGFHKASLARLCQKVGLDYTHLGQLGIPSVWRRDLNGQADYDALWAFYESQILRRETLAVRGVAELTRQKPTVLVCMEADPRRCHRARLAEAVAQLAALPVRHLGGRV